ncbi:CHASE3 domain-containing protein [Nocardioides sp.]|uniref:CHASE3 domain-containing protein n=1 Tax=Nocardioides sp. TaxID=35761 RepID=UPI0037845641
MPGPSAPHGASDGWSARTAVRLVAVLVAALSVVVGSLLVLTVVQVADAQSRLEDDLGPSRVALGAVLASYVDQETGERGYILTGRADFLQPYDDAPDRIAENLAVVRTHASAQVLERLDAVTRAHTAWLRTAERELAAARAGDRPRAVALVETGRGKELFDDVRRAWAAADATIADEQLAATRRADDLLTRLSVLLALTVLAFLGTAVLAAVAFDRTVLRPVAALGAGSRAVARGDLDHAVTVDGPREVEAVARDVDTMRRALLDELDESRRATEALALGEPAVAALQSALALRPVDRPGLAITGERSPRPRGSWPVTSSTSSTSPRTGWPSSSATCRGTARSRPSWGSA